MDSIAKNFNPDVDVNNAALCEYNFAGGEIAVFGCITNCEVFVDQNSDLLLNSSVNELGFPTERSGTSNINGAFFVEIGAADERVRVKPAALLGDNSGRCRDSLANRPLNLPLESSLLRGEGSTKNGDKSRIITPLSAASAPLLRPNATSVEVADASMLTCENLLPCVSCESSGSSRPCISVEGPRCEGQAPPFTGFGIDACRFANSKQPQLVNEFDALRLLLDGSTDLAVVAWLATQRNIDFMLGAGCAFSVLKCASDELCFPSCASLCEDVGVAANSLVQVGDVLYRTLANFTTRGWFDVTSKAALEDLYTEAAEALNTQPFLNDIIGNSFARGCADNNADFFDMFGLGSGVRPVGGGRRALQATAGSPAQAAAGPESEAAGTGVASLDVVLKFLRGLGSGLPARPHPRRLRE